MGRPEQPREEKRPQPPQAEGPDEEAGEGLEQPPSPAARAEQAGGAAGCKPDKGGIAH